MFQGKNYTLELYINDKNMNINENFFDYFEINEYFDKNIYTANLILNDMLKYYSHNPIYKGSKIDIELKTFIKDKEITYLYKFILFNQRLENKKIILTLVPWFFSKLFVEKNEIKYEDSFDKIIKKIMVEKIGFKNKDMNVETNLLEKDIYYMYNESYMSFINRNLKYLKNSNKQSNYCFFINKNDKVNCIPINSIVNSKKDNPSDELSSSMMMDLQIEDQTYSIQSTGNLSYEGNYFNWEKGTMDKYKYNIDDMLNNASSNIFLNGDFYYYKEQIPNPTIIQLDPIGLDFYTKKDHNECIIENTIQRKNYFNIFMNFKIKGDLFYSPLDVVKVNFIDGINDGKINNDGMNYALSGNYLIHSIKHMFKSTFDYFSVMRIATPIFNKE